MYSQLHSARRDICWRILNVISLFNFVLSSPLLLSRLLGKLDDCVTFRKSVMEVCSCISFSLKFCWQVFNLEPVKRWRNVHLSKSEKNQRDTARERAYAGIKKKSCWVEKRDRLAEIVLTKIVEERQANILIGEWNLKSKKWVKDKEKWRGGWITSKLEDEVEIGKRLLSSGLHSHDLGNLDQVRCMRVDDVKKNFRGSTGKTRSGAEKSP